MGGSGALGAGLHDEILVVAGEAREPVQHLQSIHTTPHIPQHRLAQRERRRIGERGRRRTDGYVGRRGRGHVDGEGHGAAEGGALVAEAEVEAVEHLAAAQLLQRRRHRSIRAAASASPSEFGCGGDVEDGVGSTRRPEW